MTIVKPLADHRRRDEERCKLVNADVAHFIKVYSSYDDNIYEQLIQALDNFRYLVGIEVETPLANRCFVRA